MFGSYLNHLKIRKVRLDEKKKQLGSKVCRQVRRTLVTQEVYWKKNMKNSYRALWQIACVFFVFNKLFSFDFQEFDTYQYKITYKEAQKKIEKYLEKDPEIRDFYQLTPEALYVGDFEYHQLDYILYLNPDAPFTDNRSTLHQGLKGAKIALDPGHFGGMWGELEERYVKIPAAKTKHGQEICFYEGDLTYLTAIELKHLLEVEGAEVFLTREGIGEGALHKEELAWIAVSPSNHGSKLFRAYYNRKDLRKRAEKINAFSPDVTLIIHYNAHLSEAEKADNNPFTQSNYNLAFIPGAFGFGELKGIEDRYEFLRLLLTDTLEQSLDLSRYIVREFVHHLDVPLITPHDTTSYIEKACLMQELGIYSRNLALTRLVHSPLCYGETLIQNNEDEAYRLAAGDVFIMNIIASKRIQEVARAYYEGVKQYFGAQK